MCLGAGLAIDVIETPEFNGLKGRTNTLGKTCLLNQQGW